MGLKLNGQPGAIAKVSGTRTGGSEKVSEVWRLPDERHVLTGHNHLTNEKEPAVIMVQSVLQWAICDGLTFFLWVNAKPLE